MTFQLILESASQAEIDAKLIEHLRERGYSVSHPHETWEKPYLFLDRIGRCRNFPLRASIREWRRRGGTVLVLDGLSGRVIELLSNPAFEAFCRRNKTTNLPVPVLAECDVPRETAVKTTTARESTQPANTRPKTNSRGGQNFSEASS